MKSYLLSILAMSLLASVCLLLLPEKAALKKGLSFLSALLLLSLLLSPLMGVAGELSEFFSGDLFSAEIWEEEYRKESDAALSGYSKDYLEALVKERLMEHFSLREGDLRVAISFDGGEPKQVLLLLSGKAIWQDSARLESFVEALLGIPCSSALE